MGLYVRHNEDGTITGRNEDTGFAVTLADEEEVKRRLCEDAGWEYTPPPPSSVPPGFHRFTLVDEPSGSDGFEDERWAGVRERPPRGCAPADRDGFAFALVCERPGRSLLDAVADTVAEIRRDHGVVMNSLGVEQPQERLDRDRDGHAGRTVAHLLLMTAHRAALLGYGRKDLVRLLDATGVR
ncbi:hypothetical protein ACWEGQ_33900 [Streptomyces seoulensis]